MPLSRMRLVRETPQSLARPLVSPSVLLLKAHLRVRGVQRSVLRPPEAKTGRKARKESVVCRNRPFPVLPPPSPSSTPGLRSREPRP